MMHPIVLTVCLLFLQGPLYAKYATGEQRTSKKDLFPAQTQINPGANWQKEQQKRQEELVKTLQTIKQAPQTPTPAPLKPTGGVLPPQYISVFAQCKDAINDASSPEEIQKALTELTRYKNSEEVKNYVKDSQPSYEELYEKLAAMGPEPIQRGSYQIVNIPGMIENYFNKLNELLAKKANE
jgi:hypothetical protein